MEDKKLGKIGKYLPWSVSDHGRFKEAEAEAAAPSKISREFRDVRNAPHLTAGCEIERVSQYCHWPIYISGEI